MASKTPMVIVFSALDTVSAQLATDYLESNGVRVVVKGKDRIALAGEIPIDDARIELLVDESVFKSAQQLLNQCFNESRPEWVCEQCKEANPGSFEHCWHCGLNRIHPFKSVP